MHKTLHKSRNKMRRDRQTEKERTREGKGRKKVEKNWQRTHEKNQVICHLNASHVSNDVQTEPTERGSNRNRKRERERESWKEREGEEGRASRRTVSYEGQQKPQRIMLNTTMKYLQHVASIPHTHRAWKRGSQAEGQANLA